MALTRIDHTKTGISLLISQYKDQPYVVALLTSYLQRIDEIEITLTDCYNYILNINEATGAQLDIVGSILNEIRGAQGDKAFRRRLKTKVFVIRSQGTVEQLINIVRQYQAAYEPDGITPDASKIYVVSSIAEKNQKSTEITYIAAKENTYEDPTPFNPHTAHDLLLLAKGAGEILQTVWAVCAPGKTPTLASLILSHNSTALSEAGLATQTITDNDGNPSTGGSLAHRRQFRGLAKITPLDSVVAPSIDTEYFTGFNLTITQGVWAGQPEQYRYTLYRFDGVDYIPIPGYIDVTYSVATSYVFTIEDTAYPFAVKETVTRAGITNFAFTNDANIYTFDLLATGGAITTASIDGDDYIIHTFSSVGTGSFEIISAGYNSEPIEYFILAGGGGATSRGGGGGAGGLLTGSVLLSPGTYNVVVGAGGPGTSGDTITWSSGGEYSHFHTFTAVSGAAGGGFSQDGHDGGSGGGGGTSTLVHGGGTGTSGQGRAGGSSWPAAMTNQRAAGGGGGAGAPGVNGLNQYITSPAGLPFTSSLGGNGLEINFNGTPTWYAGGGAGWNGNLDSGEPYAGLLISGGLGGGGNGWAGLGGTPRNGQSGATNTGGGGGSGGASGTGGSGGSGLVMLRYKIS
jgi:hypothetical protein